MKQSEFLVITCNLLRAVWFEKGKQSDKAAIRDFVLTTCPTMRSVQQWKLKLLIPVCILGAQKKEGEKQNNSNNISTASKPKVSTIC